jgi:hypothetical protein
MAKKHKRCPFCGGEPFIFKTIFAGMVYKIQCGNLDCRVETRAVYREDLAWELWDRRVKEAPCKNT